MGTKTCKCGAEFVFVLLPSGKYHPVDARPVPVVLLAEGGPPGLQQARVSHFATCPLAAVFSGMAKKQAT